MRCRCLLAGLALLGSSFSAWAAETLYKAAQAGTADVQTFMVLTDTCKNCHEKFRMTPLESSMRR